MKKIVRPFIKGTNWALAGLLSLLGFASCGDNIGETPAMYGVPWAGYAIKGTVTDKATGEPIKDIEVKVEFPDSLKIYRPTLPDLKARTNEKGEFEIQDTPAPAWVITTDVDGEKNGSFAADTLSVDGYNDAEHIGGGGGWFQGHLTKTVDVKLTQKEKEEEKE